ncbi:hypothetical protein CEXT_48831 [Caerostris extrusa]|uniref:Uncharacterized protein n=1 Tax=Caerostris extrusa TaxID=172846 RepID=A0AAV4REZ7_CAEEX|nr:hypothetical protein CEXT_48831 [Caerostris extrusa]
MFICCVRRHYESVQKKQKIPYRTLSNPSIFYADKHPIGIFPQSLRKGHFRNPEQSHINASLPLHKIVCFPQEQKLRRRFHRKEKQKQKKMATETQINGFGRHYESVRKEAENPLWDSFEYLHLFDADKHPIGILPQLLKGHYRNPEQSHINATQLRHKFSDVAMESKNKT